MMTYLNSKWMTLGGLASLIAAGLVYAFLTASPALACDIGDANYNFNSNANYNSNSNFNQNSNVNSNEYGSTNSYENNNSYTNTYGVTNSLRETVTK